MSGINGTPRNIRPSQRPLIEILKDDFKKNREAYISLGVTVAVSGYLGYKLHRVPKVDETAIVHKWLDQMAEQGINIYDLDKSQKLLWESVWAFVETQSSQPGWNKPATIARLVEDYRWIADKAARGVKVL